jgi:thioredoxin-related protein
MKKIIYVFASLSFFIALTVMVTAKELEIQAKLPKPDVKMLDISEQSKSFTDVKGENGLLVIFSCNTCPYVIASEERYLEVSQLARENKVGMMLLNANEAQRGDVDSLNEMKTHAEKYRYDFPYVIDQNSSMADLFGASKTPHVFLFDKNETLVYRGAIDDSVMDAGKVTQKYLANAMSAMVQGQPIAIDSTKSIGCSIKRK